ncbi:MAG: hypothetical protein JWM59_1122 [Verrucomicrobiales bacterium]|nr:hypothetical protein [Verrucomicrobiales bacterium]
MSAGDDDFALLGLPRRAALTTDEVRAAFQKAAAAVHPDHAADAEEKDRRTARFTRMNEASARISATTTRLRRLLALEYPDHAAAGRAVVMDEALVSLFTQVGGAVQAAAQWAAKQRGAASFLAKAALAGQEMVAREGLEAAGESIRAALGRQRDALVEIDRRREANEPVADELATLAQRAAFLEKWQVQLQSAWAGMFAALD